MTHPIAGDVIGGRGDLFNEGGADVFKLVLELHGLGDCDSILGNLGSTVGLFNHYIPSLWAQGDLDGISQFVDACEDGSSALDPEFDVLGGVSDDLMDKARGLWARYQRE